MSLSENSDPRPLFGTAAMLLFALFCAGAFAVIYRYGDLPAEMGALDFTVLGFGCLRLIHLITYDKILEPLRERLERGRAWSRLFADLVSCIWCTGMWSAVVVATVFLLGQWGRFAVWVLAIAGLGAMLQVISRAIAGCALEPSK